MQEYLSDETLHGLPKRHDVSRSLIRIWVQKRDAGAFDDDAIAADSVEAYEPLITRIQLARCTMFAFAFMPRLTLAALKP